MTWRRTAWAIGILIFLCFPQAARAVEPGGGSWPQFLGPQRNGVSTETDLLDQFPEQGPRRVWRSPGGVGMSGLAIHHRTLVTMVQDARQQSVLALDSLSGKPLWKTDVAPAFRNQMGNGPRATPTISGDKVLVFTGEGVLAALQRDDGKLLWSRDVVRENGGTVADYGMASSPLVVGKRVMVTVGADRATVAAYDLGSGARAWTAGTNHPAGYSSAALLKVDGQPQLVVYAGDAVLGIDPDKGSLLWEYAYVTDFNCNIITPQLVDGNIFFASGENHGSTLLNLTRKGAVFTAEPVWESLGRTSVLRAEWQTPILHQGHLYALDNVGSAGPITHLTCVEAATGKRVWQKQRFGKSNLIAADGKLFLSTMKGELFIVRASPDRFEELGRAQVLETTRQAPALAGGYLYLRDDREIVCLDVRKP